MTTHAKINNYFVDEAGDLTFFDRQGRIIVGREGVSRFFMVGVEQIPDPHLVNEILEELRRELTSDPYFREVPSMQSEAHKTAMAFHACKDLPEVRRDVFARLSLCKAKVFIAVRRKHEIANQAERLHQGMGAKLPLRTVYEDLVKRLFRNVLHKAARNTIVFAKHGKWVRREAMARAIKQAKANFEEKHGKHYDKPTTLQSASPQEHGGLQVIDYYLWAIQRLYERREDRFFNLLRPGYRLIMDLDDKRNKNYGEWYTDENPLTVQKIMPPAG